MKLYFLRYANIMSDPPLTLCERSFRVTEHPFFGLPDSTEVHTLQLSSLFYHETLFVVLCKSITFVP